MVDENKNKAAVQCVALNRLPYFPDIYGDWGFHMLAV